MNYVCLRALSRGMVATLQHLNKDRGMINLNGSVLQRE